MIKILSIDGGGIRGIIPAIILAEIEKRTNHPIYKLFDLIAGTSTGGVIALGLTKPNEEGKPEYQAQDLARLYEERGDEIFYQSFLNKLTNPGGLFNQKYPSKNIEKILRSYFKETLLSEALTDVLITSYEIERRDTFFFKSTHARKNKTRNFLMKDAARATSAAPTYFEPEKIPTGDLTEYYALVDGGVFANNPAMCALVEAKTMFPDEKDFLVVSLGTGELTRPIYYKDARSWGLAHWSHPILSVVFDGVSDSVDYQLRQLLPTIEDNQKYYRFQIRLDDASDDMDNTKTDNLRALKLYAEGIIREQTDILNSLCQKLIKHN
jgi:uncharacterized protein